MTGYRIKEETLRAARMALAAFPTETYASLSRKLGMAPSTLRRIAVDEGLVGLRGFGHTQERRELRGLASTAPVLRTRSRRPRATLPEGQGQFDFPGF